MASMSSILSWYVVGVCYLSMGLNIGVGGGVIGGIVMVVCVDVVNNGFGDMFAIIIQA